MAADLKIILRLEILQHDILQMLVPGDHLGTHQLAQLGNILTHLMLQLGLAEKPVPVVLVLIFALGHGPVHQTVKMADADTFGGQIKAAGILLENMRKKHGGRVALPDLHGTDVAVIAVRIQVHKNLGIIPDLGNRGKRMPSAHDGIVGAAAGLIDQRTDNGKEIGHHQVGGPGGLQP